MSIPCGCRTCYPTLDALRHPTLSVSLLLWVRGLDSAELSLQVATSTSPGRARPRSVRVVGRTGGLSDCWPEAAARNPWPPGLLQWAAHGAVVAFSGRVNRECWQGGGPALVPWFPIHSFVFAPFC